MNYTIENNIDFYSLLNKEISSSNIIDTSNNTQPTSNYNICLLTNLPLKDNFIKLDCSHSFNYIALYNEVTSQKKFSCLETTFLKANHIKCPYCRSITEKLLPFIPYPNVISRKWVNTPSKYSINLFQCEWTHSSGKNKNHICSSKLAYKWNNNTYCYKHHNKYDNKILNTQIINNIVWTDSHNILYKKYKLNELKELLKNENLSYKGSKKILVNTYIQYHNLLQNNN